MKKLIPVLICLILSLPCLAHDYLSQKLINSINESLDEGFARGMSPSWLLESSAKNIAFRAIELNDKNFLDYIRHIKFKQDQRPYYGGSFKGREIIRKASEEIDFANQKREEEIHIKELRKLELEIKKNELRKNIGVEENITIDKNSKKSQTIIIPASSIGEISDVRKQMLEKNLESKLDDYFDIVPKELFEEAQEQAFQEMDADECTEERCIAMIQEILQVPNAFQLILMVEEGDTQISITWNDMQKKRVEENYCEGCKTKELRDMIEEMVVKLVGR